MKYGHNRTIHGTQEVNIERDPETGAVVSVWFRCALLPFTDRVVDRNRAESMRDAYRTRPRGILGIEFSEASAPDSETGYELRGIGMHPKEFA
jgi:hypothetical protein